MNPFLNPITSIPFLKNYFTIPRQLHKRNPKYIRKLRNKSFRKIVKYAYTIPIYNKKYKKAGLHPNDIRGIEDISKLPFITKKDFIESFPEGIKPANYDTKNAKVVSTSGSTGKPVSFYIDFPTLSTSVCFGMVREGVYFGYNWSKMKLVSLGNFSKGKADQVFDEILTSKSKPFRNSNNYLTLNAFDEMKAIIKKLDEFKPDYIVTYPVTLQELAYFKKKGYGKNIRPKIMVSSGYVLDEYTRSYVEDAFDCPLINGYTSAEGMSDISIECLEKTWHINYDAFHIEAIDEENNIVAPGEKGHVVMTRLFGKATPFIRYTGMDDWVTVIPEYKCDCGLCTPILKNGVEGRSSTSVVLPNGQVIPSASFAIITLILKDLKTYKVKQFQIIQHKIDKIDILLVIDEDLRDKPPSVDFIIKKIKEAYEKRCGPDVDINVKEVKELKSPKGKPLPLVVSKIKPEEGFKRMEELSFSKK
jgi:phenylacetate-CoA ligase